MSTPHIMFACPLTSLMSDTDGKLLIIASLLQKEGFGVTVMCWSPEGEAACKQLSLPYLALQCSTVVVDQVAEAKKFVELLGGRQLIEHPLAPTWGEILGFDDFIGLAQEYRVQGTDSARPDLLLLPLPGGECSTPEDEQVRVVLHRWARQNHIPIIGLDCQSPKTSFTLQQFPVQMKLSLDGGDYSYSFPLQYLYRYLCSHGHEAAIEQALQEEASLRKGLQWAPGVYYLYFPLHLYYLQETIALLQVLAPVWHHAREAGVRLLLSCGTSHRRGLSERDIIEKALRPWMGGMEYVIAEGNAINLKMALLSEAVLMPFPHNIHSLLEWYGLPVWGVGEVAAGVEHLRLRVRPQEAIIYLLEQYHQEERKTA